jgi:hypothetical protein
MSSETPDATVEVMEEAAALPEDSVIEADASPAAATNSTPAPMGLSKDMTDIMNGIVRRLTDARDKEE